jgi:acetyl esterase/lipase
MNGHAGESTMPSRSRIVFALILTSLALAPAICAAEPQAPGVKVIRNVSYGPHGPRNVMDIFLPEAGSAPRPLIICVHGGGWAGGDKRAFGWMAEAFAREGFAAVSINYRFAPAFRAPTQMDDVQRAVRWLRKNAAQYELDGDRFGAIGGSAGAHLAAWLGLVETRDNSDTELARYSSRVQCVVDCYGPVDLAGMMSSASAPIVEGFLGKPFKGNEQSYRDASPSHQPMKGAPPFLIIHGTRDIGTSRGQVPIEQSIEFHDKLRQAGADSTLIKLEGAGHGFTGNPASKHAQDASAAATAFFKKHLARR